MNLKVVGIGLIVLIVIGGLAYVLPALLQDDANMTVRFYNSDGDKVFEKSTTPFWWPFSFETTTGEIVTTAEVGIDFSVSLTGGLEGATTEGKLVVTSHVEDFPNLLVKKLDILLEAKSGLSGNYTKMVTLLDLIYTTAYETATTYIIVFTATLTATASDGTESEPWTGSVTVFLDWVPASVGISATIIVRSS